MTDEEMAEEYANSQVGCGDGFYEWEDVKDGFLAGLKAARPQWHKVADGDLPKENQLVLLYRENPNGANIALTYWYKSYVKDKVIAWCEIPTFDKE